MKVYLIMKEYYGDVSVDSIFECKYAAERHKYKLNGSCFECLHTYYWIDEMGVKLMNGPIEEGGE